jgi:diguanylate cyclase (GGDEF)-like protein
LWLLLVVALVLNLFAWINDVLAAPPMAALMAACAVVLVGIPLVLNYRLTRVRRQRDQALARISLMASEAMDLQRKRELGAGPFVTQRVQELLDEIADLHCREQLLQIQAHHDSLTGLANRILLADRFRFAVERAKRSNKSFALLMIDLDQFKSINDDYGHAAGDAVLVIMAGRLVEAVRASDTVARLGGDEFVLIVESVDNPQELAQIGQKLIDTLSNPIPLDSGVVLNMGASVGLALYPYDGVTMDDLLHSADLGMYECKSTGQISLQ